MKKIDHLFAKNDLIIIKKLITLKKPIMITVFSKYINIAHKSVNPRVEFLNNIKLVNIKIEGRRKLIEINKENIDFSKKLIFLFKEIPLT